ncbi:Disulfide isomerase L-2 isoform 1 [Hibiscus syriacus]|uniref:Disulfide isomerase L-2 isoform 1 n=1 Tax=Hibiscus syriacus TaxID=106335 RepID=A0A6A2ZJH5_HIBSY|nr:Disulfide isomerase L-2 isoform 1 [Hibiscus syriacus]
MAKLCPVTIAFFQLLQLAFAADSPSPPPSLGADLSPHLAPDLDSPPAISPALDSSPPAPSPSDLEQGGSPLPPISPAPSPEEASDINHNNVNADVGEENTGRSGGGGMSGGKKRESLWPRWLQRVWLLSVDWFARRDKITSGDLSMDTPQGQNFSEEENQLEIIQFKANKMRRDYLYRRLDYCGRILH